jgi:protein-S-isoprenylcysteine O-methyltransferase Ste14
VTIDHIALILAALYALLAFALRALLHLRRTGSTGVVLLRGGAGALERLSGLLFLAGGAAVFCAPLVHLLGVAPLGIESDLFGVAVAVYAAGLSLTVGAQHVMGASWRVGVDAGATTALVTQGPFAEVRNPIFTGLLLSTAGMTLLIPSPVTIAGWFTLLAGIELQVRRVEEPYLLRTHGKAYASYAARTGRFVPWLGALRAD